MHFSTTFRRAALAAALAALAACTSAPPVSDVSLAALETRAENARATGDPVAAATLYRQLAASSRGAQRVDFLIAAAQASLEADDTVAAGLSLADARSLATPMQLAAVEILTARIDAGAGRAAEALARLEAAGPVSDAELASIGSEARGLALFALDRPADAVAVLVEREIWLDTSADVLANQRLIWNGLADLQTTPPEVTDEIVAGWLALVPLTRQQNDPAQFRRALIDWRTRYATHPAAGGILADIVAAQRGALKFPQRIALLLPLGSIRRIQAQAVRDGFLAARIADSRADETTVTVYDTAEAGPAAAYLRAQSDGADFIVGPLLPESVDAIVPQTGFVPTLTLNFSQLENVTFPSSLYQYALAPEDEARAIARRAIAEGQRRAVALFASTDRGYRLMASFRQAFEALGGEVLAASAYVPESQDASGPITDILNIARSGQRHRRLQANLGRAVEFESRRRQDVDMIFLQATPGLGRLLTPQLLFHQAGDIPTYATSDIYDPAFAGRDSDLNGVIFPDLPIVVSPDPDARTFTDTLRQIWPQQSRQWIRLYSFGFDAYGLIRPIFNPAPGDWPRSGITGILELDTDGRVHRSTLPFAQFRNGTPSPLAPVAVTELSAISAAPTTGFDRSTVAR